MPDDTRPIDGETFRRDLDPLTQPFGPVGDPALEPTVAQSASPAMPVAAGSAVATFGGRTPDRTSAIRAGVVLGAALVVALGTAVVMGASPSLPGSTSNAGADPSAAAAADPSGKPEGSDDGHGSKAFRAFGAFGPFSFGPGPASNDNGNGRGDRFGGPGFGKITVTGVSGSNVSLATDDGWKRTITVTSDTKITKGGEAATIGDVQPGDVVRIGQHKNDDGTYTITALAIVLPQTGGTVTAVDAGSFAIKLRDGTTKTINTNGSTKYHLGRADGTHADVKVGSTVFVVGEQPSSGNLTATSVTVILPRVGGTVDAVSGNTITILRRDGTKLTVHVGSNTTIGVAGVDKATVADVKAGMMIVVQGTQRTDGSLDATSLQAGQFKKGDHGTGGKAPTNQSTPSAAPSGSTG